MRKNKENQMPLSPLWPDHQLGKELQMISQILDDNPQIDQRIRSWKLVLMLDTSSRPIVDKL